MEKNIPLLYLKTFLENNISVFLKNDKKISGKLFMFDEHYNLLVRVNSKYVIIRGDMIFSINKIL